MLINVFNEIYSHVTPFQNSGTAFCDLPKISLSLSVSMYIYMCVCVYLYLSISCCYPPNQLADHIIGIGQIFLSGLFNQIPALP